MNIINLNEEQAEDIQDRLETYDDEHIKYRIEAALQQEQKKTEGLWQDLYHV